MTGLSHEDVATPDRCASCLRHTKQPVSTWLGDFTANAAKFPPPESRQELLRTIETVLREMPADVPLTDRALQQLGYSLTVVRSLMDLFHDEMMRDNRIAAIRHPSERTPITAKDGA